MNLRAAGGETDEEIQVFGESQIAFILKQAEDGVSVGEVCRKAGISQATFYYWRNKYAGLMPSEMKRLRQPEEENVTRAIGGLSEPSVSKSARGIVRVKLCGLFRK